MIDVRFLSQFLANLGDVKALWPESITSMFAGLSAFNFNVELLGPEVPYQMLLKLTVC